LDRSLARRRDELVSVVAASFAGVALGGGVSIRETVALDEYASPESRRTARAFDEAHDWSKVVGSREIMETWGVGGPAFLDAEGLRFYLPVYLMLLLKGDDTAPDVAESVRFTLTSFDDHNLDRLWFLSREQRCCVRDIVIFLRERAFAIDDDASYDQFDEALPIWTILSAHHSRSPSAEAEIQRLLAKGY
jgi:hypothetical protein